MTEIAERRRTEALSRSHDIERQAGREATMSNERQTT
jgi:hypothetical protein